MTSLGGAASMATAHAWIQRTWGQLPGAILGTVEPASGPASTTATGSGAGSRAGIAAGRGSGGRDPHPARTSAPSTTTLDIDASMPFEPRALRAARR